MAPVLAKADTPQFSKALSFDCIQTAFPREGLPTQVSVRVKGLVALKPGARESQETVTGYLEISVSVTMAGPYAAIDLNKIIPVFGTLIPSKAGNAAYLRLTSDAALDVDANNNPIAKLNDGFGINLSDDHTGMLGISLFGSFAAMDFDQLKCSIR